MNKYLFKIVELLEVCEYGNDKEEAREKIIERLEKREFVFSDPVVSDGELIK
jgi:hypothetical protein